MGQLRSQWQTYKSALDGVGVKTSIFSQDFGPRLDTFDTARSNYDSQLGRLEPKDPKWIAIKNALKESGLAVEPIFMKYTDNVSYLLTHATDNKQKPPLENAQSWLVRTMSATIVPYVKKAST